MRTVQAKFAGSSVAVSKKPSRKLPEFAFIGRSNVGKSSLINMLCSNGSLAKTSSKPGKTRVVNHFLVNDSWYLVDLPGYGYAKLPDAERNKIRDVISDYILNSEELTCLFVLVDSRHDIQRIDLDFLSELGENNIPVAIILTKCDKQGPVALKAQIDRDCVLISDEWEELPPIFCSSSESGAGKDEILGYIESILKTE